MPSRESLLTFREGLKVIQTVDDYATLKDTIIKMMAFTIPEDAHYARDAIARTMRKKQAAELQRYQGYPQAISNLDQKYRDLYIMLKKAKTAPKPVVIAPDPQLNFQQQASKVTATPKQAPTQAPKQATNNKSSSDKKQMVKVNAFDGLNTPLMIVNWLKGKRKTIFIGTALASSIGGLYWMYKFLTREETEDNPEKEKENSFDRTIKSIQRYRAFTQASKDPDFMGDYEALVSGRLPTKEKIKKKVKKKPELDKSTEWEQEERILMRNMDSAFNAIGTKPRVKYEIPQLPEPKGIDPNSVLTRPNEEAVEKPKRKKPRRKRKSPQVEIKVEDRPKPSKMAALSMEPTIPRPKKVKRSPLPKKTVKSRGVKKKQQTTGRLIPIVKRTKRVKKVQA